MGRGREGWGCFNRRAVQYLKADTSRLGRRAGFSLGAQAGAKVQVHELGEGRVAGPRP